LIRELTWKTSTEDLEKQRGRYKHDKFLIITTIKLDQQRFPFNFFYFAESEDGN